jgi:trimeric autotransporter adhesin
MISTRTKLHHLVATSALVLFAALGRPDTAQAQNTLLFSPSVVNFSTVLNGTPASQTVNVSLNNFPVSSLQASLPTYAAGQTAGWIASVVPTTNGAQSFLTINVVNTGLFPGTYNATIGVTAQGIAATIPVVLTVFSSTALVPDQTTLNFTAQTNGTSSSPQTVNVTSVGQNGQPTPGVSFAAISNQPYIVVNASSTVTPSQLSVSTNSAGLAAGPYSGTITLSSTGLAPVTIAVNLTVSALPSIVANPNPVNLLYQSGVGAPAPAQSVQLTSATPLNYSGVLTYNPANTCGGNWLQVTSGLIGATPSSINLTANVVGLTSPQSCTATITISSPGAANPTLTIPVNLSISPNPQIGVNPGFLNFSYSVGAALPAQQSLTVFTSNNTALNYSVSAPNAPWLALPQTPVNGFPSTTPVTVGLSQAATALNPGTYAGTIVISSLGSGIAPVNVPVTLTVSNNPLLLVTPPILNFNYQTFQTGGSIPNPLTFNLSSTLGSIPFALSVPTTTNTQFVSFQPLSGTATTTPTPISVALNSAVVTALAPGTYQTAIQVSGTGASAGTPVATVQVNLTVSTTPLVNVSPQSIVFASYTQGAPLPQPVVVSLTSTNAAVPLGVVVSANVPWLAVSGVSSATTPSQFNVTIAPAGLTPGTYTGLITVTSGAQVQQIPATLTITSGIAVSVTPATPLIFTQALGGPAPAAQVVTVNTTGGQPLAFSANAATTTPAGGSWLLINGTTATFAGNAPGPFSVSVNSAGLAAGTYTGSIIITAINASNPSVVIPVTLTVTGAQTLAANQTSLTFTGAVGGGAPAAQTISITSTTGSPVVFATTAQPLGGNWLTVSPATGTTPATVTVTANQAGLAAGSYTGTVTLTPTAAGSTPLTIPVTLTVGTQPAPTIVTVQNGASFGSGAVAPGEIISLFGTALGPVTPVGVTLTASGNVSTNIGNTQVFFDGVAAPLTYVAAGQINVVVPYEVAGKTTTQITVNFNGIVSPPISTPVSATAPAIFTVNGQGSGPGAILNQNTTLNTAANPAPAGSVVVIFATGEGVTNPAVPSGTVIGATLPKPVAPVTVTIGGLPATIQYAGSAPGEVAGVLQLNVVVPAGIAPNAAVPVTVRVGTVTSQSNVTLALQ